MRRRVKRQRQRKAFTLMEVLLVMAILVIIGSVVSVSYIGIQKRSKRNGAKMQIGELEQAVELYQLQIGTAPANLEELKNGPANAAAAKDFKPGEIWNKEIPVDPWGNNYVYKYDNQNEKILIYSVGPNGSDESGGGDDIRSDS